MAQQPLRKHDRDDEVDEAIEAVGGGGLTRKIIDNALLFGEAERRTCTKDDIGILKGLIGTGRPMRYLRERLREHHWRREEPKSLPLVVSPDGKTAITVAAGDADTGNPKAPFASTKWPKGPMLRDWVDPSRQLDLFGTGLGEEPEELPDLRVLLIRRTQTEIIAELSRPTSVAPNDQIRFGGDRIFLKRLPIDQTIPFDSEDQHDDDSSTEVSVERI